MQIETLKDVLHWSREFHQYLSQCLSHCAKTNPNERARMILEYLANHEKTLAEIAGGFATTGDEHALNTWCYEYVTHHPITQHDFCDTPFADLDEAQIMTVVVNQHQVVLELYQDISSRAVIPSAKELLERLRSSEEHEAMRMVQDTNRFSDM